MATILALIATALCLWATVAILRHYHLKNALSPSRFALIFATGWSITLLTFYFVNLVFNETIQVTVSLVGLGLAIGLLNFSLGYPLAYFAYKLLGRFLKSPRSPVS